MDVGLASVIITVVLGTIGGVVVAYINRGKEGSASPDAFMKRLSEAIEHADEKIEQLERSKDHYKERLERLERLERFKVARIAQLETWGVNAPGPPPRIPPEWPEIPPDRP